MNIMSTDVDADGYAISFMPSGHHTTLFSSLYVFALLVRVVPQIYLSILCLLNRSGTTVFQYGLNLRFAF